MIKLKGVGKVYCTRRKRKIYGLQDINLSFPDKGLCVILGQSGGGKTTLLNILGGLDVKYEGEYEFMGKKLCAKDFDELRQNHISFVFQDFNLIEDYTVSENVALGVTLSQDANASVSNALRKVGLDDYGNRYPKQLSGGQQQRIAIARALLKKSSVLLADEPTGNLDIENSTDIYNLLKEISRDKLVVVVTHDEEAANSYADYIVRLKKGKIVESNLPESECALTYSVGKRHVISNKQAFKMGAREITATKVKSAFTIVLMAVCFCVLSFTVLSVPLFRMSDVHYSLVKDKNYKYVCFSNTEYGEYANLKRSGVDIITAYGDRAVLYDGQIEGLNLEFYDGVLPLDENSYYVSDYALRKLATPDIFGISENYAIIDGEETLFTVDRIPKLVGQRIKHYGYDKICAGIFKSKLHVMVNQYELYSQMIDSSVICTELPENTKDYDAAVWAKYDDKNVDISGKFGYGSSIGNVKPFNYERNVNPFQTFILTSEGIMFSDKDYTDIQSALDGEEVFVGVDMYNRIFETKYSAQNLFDFDDFQPIVKRIPTDIGKQVIFEFSDGSQIEVVIKGILFGGDFGITSENNEIIFSKSNACNRNEMRLRTQLFDAWIETDSVRNLRGLMATRNIIDGNCNLYTPVSRYENQIRSSLQAVQLSLLAISFVLIVATILTTNLVVSGQIMGQKRKIGIYRALGAKISDITKIYLFEMLIIAIPMIILAVSSTAVVTTLLNWVYARQIDKELTLISYKWVNIPITVFSVLAVLLVGILSPLRKITKLNVIAAIKGTSDK